MKSGEYDSPSDVVVHALYLLEACDRFREAQLEALRREIAIGIEQCDRGEVAELDIEEIIGEARQTSGGGTRLFGSEIGRTRRAVVRTDDARELISSRSGTT